MERRAVERDIGLGGRLVAPLFVPGDRPDRVRKARVRSAKAIVIDLEDAVALSGKAAARTATAAALDEDGADAAQLVRVNAASEPELLDADVEALTRVLPAVDGVILPKVESPAEVRQLEQRLLAAAGIRRDILPTIESALGVRYSWEIAAASDSVHTLLFGSVDVCAQLGLPTSPDGLELLTARSTVVLACAAAGLTAPVDGPYLAIGDATGLAVAAQTAVRLGFGGKVAIHPDQVAGVVEQFAPTQDEVDWASRVEVTYNRALAEGVGVARMEDGTFIDVPVAQRARAILHGRGARAHQPD